MAKKKETKEVPPDSPLVTAAKTIGVAAGKIATTVGVVTPTQPKVPKLAKKLRESVASTTEGRPKGREDRSKSPRYLTAQRERSKASAWHAWVPRASFQGERRQRRSGVLGIKWNVMDYDIMAFAVNTGIGGVRFETY